MIADATIVASGELSSKALMGFALKEAIAAQGDVLIYRIGKIGCFPRSAMAAKIGGAPLYAFLDKSKNEWVFDADLRKLIGLIPEQQVAA